MTQFVALSLRVEEAVCQRRVGHVWASSGLLRQLSGRYFVMGAARQLCCCKQQLRVAGIRNNSPCQRERLAIFVCFAAGL
jgi:hypothetical protein